MTISTIDADTVVPTPPWSSASCVRRRVVAAVVSGSASTASDRWQQLVLVPHLAGRDELLLRKVLLRDELLKVVLEQLLEIDVRLGPLEPLLAVRRGAHEHVPVVLSECLERLGHRVAPQKLGGALKDLLATGLERGARARREHVSGHEARHRGRDEHPALRTG
jgi:hypothetical protein